jgi:hypothetical protein
MDTKTTLAAEIRIETDRNESGDYRFVILAQPIEWSWPDGRAGWQPICQSGFCFASREQAEKDAAASLKAITTGKARPSPEPSTAPSKN